MSYKILHDVKCHTFSDRKCHTIFSVTESVILMKFGELSYFGNFFDFGKVFGDIHPFGLGPEVKWGRSGASWRHLEAPYTPEKIKLTKIIYGLPLLLLKTF